MGLSSGFPYIENELSANTMHLIVTETMVGRRSTRTDRAQRRGGGITQSACCCHCRRR